MCAAAWSVPGGRRSAQFVMEVETMRGTRPAPVRRVAAGVLVGALALALLAVSDDTPRVESAKPVRPTPTPTTTPPPAVGLMVMAYNIHHGENTKQQYDLQAIADVINAQRPVLAALNEVDKAWGERSNFDDQPAKLAQMTGMIPCYGPNLTSGSAQYGNLILSTYPTLECKNTLRTASPGRVSSSRKTRTNSGANRTSSAARAAGSASCGAFGSRITLLTRVVLPWGSRRRGGGRGGP